MQSRNVIRTTLFAVFFSSGAAAVAGSLLCDDLAKYYQNKQLLKAAQQYLDRLQSLNTDYDVLLSRLEKDPNLIKRVASATLGIEQKDPNTVYPKLTPQHLAAARKALDEDVNQCQTEPVVPSWLRRLREPRRRIMLFLAGAGLILISFTCFAELGDRG